MTGDEVVRDPIDELAEEFLARYRRGERPALSEYVGRRPDLADDIRDLFPALVMMEEVGPGEPHGPAGFGRGAAAGRTPERLGDYRILREVGRGGMGVVYEAEQESLGRHVALKVLPAEAAEDMTCLKRFCREARSAARLHHTNIVPVHDVGAHEGLHYYAMQFIQGQNLDEVLDELRRLRRPPAAPRVGAGSPRQVVAGSPDPAPRVVAGSPDPVTVGTEGLLQDPSGRPAVESSGTVRRPCPNLTQSLASHLLSGQFGEADLAPEAQAVERPPDSDTGPVCTDRAEFSTSSNWQYYRSLARIGLQVAEALAYAHGQGVLHRDIKPGNLLLDQRGTVWVTDFGLAKDEGEALTRTGNVVGTLRYLPPERFNGISDARGDVCSLGLTLYELLTLRPAFNESDQVKLIQQVVHEEPPPPRRYDPRVPRDLETIVLKAMAKEPDRRYQTAEEMATDLRLFLADEPIRARRSSLLEKLMRLGRRNPLVTGLSVVVAVLAAISLVVLIVAGLVERERDKAVLLQQRAETAEQEEKKAKTENKVREHLARAAAIRRSGQVGQRFQSLDQLKLALDLGPAPALRREIRDEAVAALVLPDVAIARDWPGWPEDTVDLHFDDSLQRFARLDKLGGVALCRVTGTGEEVVGRLPWQGGAPYRRVWMSPDGRFVLGWRSPPVPEPGAAIIVWQLDWQRAGLAPMKLCTVEVPSALYGPAFTPDSRHLAVVRTDRLVDIYDLETGQVTRQLATDVPVYSLAFHPGGETLAVSSGPDVLVFEVATGRQCQRLHHPEGVTGVTSLAWHPAGRRLLTACDDRKIHVWDAVAGREVMPPWRGQANVGITLAFNHAGDRLVSIDWDVQTRLWDATSGRVLLTLPGNFGLQFSADDTMLGPQHSGSNVRLWRVAAGRELHVLRHPAPDGRESLAWPVPDADGRVLAANSSQGLCFFDVASGEELASVHVPNPDFTYFQCFIPPGGWLTSISGNGTLLWPVQAALGQPHLLDVGPPQHFSDEGFAGASATPDGRVAALAMADGALLVHRQPPRPRFALKPQKDVRHMAVSPDGRWVVTCSFAADPVASVQIWNAETGEHVRNLPQGEWSTPSFSPDSRCLAVTTRHQDCRLWEVGTWREMHCYDEAYVAFSPDRRTLALDNVIGQVRLVETETDREVVRLTGPEPLWYDPACFTPDGARLIAVARDHRAIYVWDLRSIREQLREIRLDWDGPEFPAAAPLGRSLAVRVDPGFLKHETDFPDARQAVAVLTLALALQPMNPETYLQRGRAYGRLSQAPEASADYSAFLVLTRPDDPRRAEVLFRRASNALHVNDQAAMLAALLALTQLDCRGVPWPGEVAARCNDVAWGLVAGPEKDRRPEQGLALARKAVELEPDDGSYRNTLGIALYRDGQYREAVAILEANPHNADFVAWDLYFLAMAFHQLKDETQAKTSWDHAVRWQQEKENGLTPLLREELVKIRAEAEALLGPR